MLKKIELHVHLDGSISLDLASKLSNLSLLEIKEKMVAHKKCNDLSEYLNKFDFPISLMQSEKNLKLISKDLVDNLEKDGVIYAEIRFCPLYHTKEGLDLDKVIKSVLEGLGENKNVKTNLLLCMMRELSYEDNKKIIDLAKKYLGRGVVGIDLAGNEKKYKLKNYKNLFIYAKKNNIPYTIHAGEVDDVDLLDAINLSVKRIGHGVKCIKDPKLISLIKEKNILLEVCPTSNIDTNQFNNIKDHPVYELYKNKVNILINTDNRTVSNTTLEKEYTLLLKNFPFNESDLYFMNLNSINYAFLSSEEKLELLEKIKFVN